MSPRLLRLRTAALALAATTVIPAALPALAHACTVTTTGSEAFSQFGDTSLYALAPGGSFESGTSGWTLNGASVKSGNESYYVNSRSDSHALWISPTGDPISAPICVSSSTPTFRFFARQTNGGWAEMNINVLWTGSSGVSHVSTAGGLSPTTSWAPSPAYDLGLMLPLWQLGSTLSVRIQFVPAATGGGIAIDDLEIDPYSK